MRKGVSPVIAVVMLVLLTVAAIGIIAGFLIPFVKNSLSDSTACFEYRDYFKFEGEFGYNCYATSGTDYVHAVSVKSGSDKSKEEGIKGFEVVFLKAGSSTKKTILNGGASGASAGEIKMLGGAGTLVVPQAGEMRTYVLNGSTNLYTGVEVYPILQTDKVCDLSDKMDIRVCGPGVTVS